jgi:hypothetical protein
MSDVFCAAVLDGDPGWAKRYNAERAWRFVIALTAGDQSGAEQIEAELGDCPTCWTAFSRYLGGALSGMIIGRTGPEAALQVAESQLAEILALWRGPRRKSNGELTKHAS